MSDETTIILSVEELKNRLHLADIDYSKYNDNDLETLIDLTIQEIENRTEAPILEPMEITEYHHIHMIDTYVTSYNHIIEPIVSLNGEEVSLKHIDTRNGILYFTTRLYGDLKISYNIQYDNQSLLQELITNMTILQLEGDLLNGQWKSIKEGDVSVTTGDNGNSLYDKVETTLDKISGYYKPKARILG